MTFFDGDDSDAHNDAVVDALRVKAEFWRYEQEWRVIEPDGARKFKAFNPQIITGFTLGARIKGEDEMWLREVAAGHGRQVNKVEADLSSFGLRFR